MNVKLREEIDKRNAEELREGDEYLSSELLWSGVIFSTENYWRVIVRAHMYNEGSPAYLATFIECWVSKHVDMMTSQELKDADISSRVDTQNTLINGVAAPTRHSDEWVALIRNVPHPAGFGFDDPEMWKIEWRHRNIGYEAYTEITDTSSYNNFPNRAWEEAIDIVKVHRFFKTQGCV